MSRSQSPHERVEEILRKHFPAADEDVLKECALDILQHWLSAQTHQDIARSNVRPKNDIENIQKPIKHLRKAASALDDIGWHGGKALMSLALDIRSERLPQDYRAIVSSLDTAEVVQRKLTELVVAMETACESIDLDGKSVFEHVAGKPALAPVLRYMDESYRRGRPKEVSAIHVARECIVAFEKLSAQRAGRRTDFWTGESHGPFLELVSDVFENFDITSDAGRAGRNALTMDKNHEKE